MKSWGTHSISPAEVSTLLLPSLAILLGAEACILSFLRALDGVYVVECLLPSASRVLRAYVANKLGIGVLSGDRSGSGRLEDVAAGFEPGDSRIRWQNIPWVQGSDSSIVECQRRIVTQSPRGAFTKVVCSAALHLHRS